jgi:hypothetical protein
MVRTIRRCWLSMAVLLLGVPSSFAQPPELLGTPRPLSSQLVPTYLPAEPARPVGTASYGSLEDRNGALLVGNVYLDGPRSNLGWFATADVDLLAVHVNNQLTGTVPVGPNNDQVSLPAAKLRWTVAPRFELGYRFGQGAGELLVAYRFLGASGSTTTPAFDLAGNPGVLRSRLAMNVIDLDYANQENSLQPWCDMKWRFGIRLAHLYFASEEQSPLLQQHVTNRFFGAGPHGALELWRPIAESHFGLFGKLDAAGVMGKVQQGFAETVPGPVSGFTRQSQFMPSAMLNVQAGIGWTPTDHWRFSAGYTYEHWWDAAFAGGSRGDVATQGVFLRGEWRY